MFGRRSSPALRAELDEVNRLIAAHPLASPRVRAAHDVIDNSPSRDVEEVERQLADGGLPSVRELGEAQVAGSWSWWKLHRRKRKLEQRIRRLDRP
jgi:hypothetical protein